MKLHHLLMIGAGLALVVLTVTGAVGGPLGTLLLVGLLLLCPLMMLGMHGGASHDQSGEHPPAGPERRESPGQEVGRDGR